MNKNIIKRIIWWSLKRFHLSIRKDYPRESHHFLKEYFKDKEIRGAEIGVFYGVNSLWFFKMLNIQKMYLVDPYGKYVDYHDGKKIIQDFSRAKETAFNRLRRYNSEFLYLNSEEAFKELEKKDEKLDFVYIDANHNYEFVKRDIENYWKLLKKGGLMVGHDFAFYSVAKAVVEFAEKRNLKVITKAKDGEWIIVK